VQHQQKTGADNDRQQHVTSPANVSHSKQVRVASSPQSASGGGVVGGPSQHVTKGHSAPDESGANTTSRTVRTVVYDDDYEDSTKGNYMAVFTSDAPVTSQVSSHETYYAAMSLTVVGLTVSQNDCALIV